MASVISIFKSNNLAYVSKVQNNDTKQEKLVSFYKFARASSGVLRDHFDTMLDDIVDVETVYFDRYNVQPQTAKEIIKQTLKSTGFIVL